jgi:hypothetical protein
MESLEPPHCGRLKNENPSVNKEFSELFDFTLSELGCIVRSVLNVIFCGKQILLPLPENPVQSYYNGNDYVCSILD